MKRRYEVTYHPERDGYHDHYDVFRNSRWLVSQPTEEMAKVCIIRQKEAEQDKGNAVKEMIAEDLRRQAQGGYDQEDSEEQGSEDNVDMGPWTIG